MGQARNKFIARRHLITFTRESKYHEAAQTCGAECIYCREYFVNAKIPKFGGYVCKNCSVSI